MENAGEKKVSCSGQIALRRRACAHARHFVTPFAQKKRAEIEKNVAAARAKHAEFHMHAVEREAAQLVRRFHAAPSRQQAHVARTLVEFCRSQPQEREWQDVGGRAGVVPALTQAAKSSDSAFQLNAVAALASLVSDHKCNQSAAAAAGAIPHLMQLTKSSDAALQREAVGTLGMLVGNNADNQYAAAAAGAIPHLMQLTKSSDYALQQKAGMALGWLVFDHHGNQSTAGAAGSVECMCNLLSSDSVQVAFAAAFALNQLSSLADNARRAVSMGAMALLLLLQTRYNSHEAIDQVLAKLVQVSV